ncbi:MAG: PAS domain-containing protein [Phenylobacterium sp.]|nr:PAS domain-containing protein [Phenylobacterium sp.]
MRADAPVAASPQAAADREQLALIAVERTRMPMVVTDPRQPDNPIVLANQAFLELCGYEASEVLGRNCRFLQGPLTDTAAVAELRAAIAAQHEHEVELLNYRRDGTPFWNQLHLSPIRDLDGSLIYFFASQKDVSERRRAEALKAAEHRLLKEVDHRAMNALALVQGIVRLSRADTVGRYAAVVQSRVQAIAQAHSLLSRNRWTEIPLAEVVRGAVERHAAERVGLEGPDLVVAPAQVQPLFLTLHELIDNARTHGALAAPSGTISIVWGHEIEAGRTTLIWKERGGRPAERGPPGFGTQMINATLKRQLGGSVRRSWLDDGLELEMTFPAARASREPFLEPR